MLNHKLLISYGFSLNEYREGKFYELTVQEPTTTLLCALGYAYDPEMVPEQVIIQIGDDFSGVRVMIDVNCWDFPTEGFEEVLKALW